MTYASTGPKLGSTVPYYGGGQVPDPANVLTMKVAPSSSAVHNKIGTIAVNTALSNAYILVNKTSTTATWALVGGASGSVDMLTPDSGGAVSPSAGNITVAGGSGVSTAGTANTVTFNVVGGGLKTVVLTAAGNAATNTSYVNNNSTGSSSLTITLQATGYALGDIVEVVGLSTNNSAGAYWILQANTGATFHSGATSGASAGTLTGTQRYSSIQVKAVAITTGAVTDWVVLNQSGTVSIA
jgi:hypothetical protein